MKKTTIGYDQAVKFWNACMKSKEAKGMASFLDLPATLRRHDVECSSEQSLKAERSVANFLRAVAGVLEKTAKAAD